MKKMLILFLLLPLLVSAQTNKKGNLKIRKQPKIQAYATIAGIFDGVITKATLLANPTIELSPAIKGEIISFNCNYSYNGDFVASKNIGKSIPLRALKSIKNYNLNQIYFEKIYAKIANDTIQLNNIILKFGKQNSTSKKTNVASTTYLRGKNYNIISKKNLSEILKIKGIYEDKILQVKTCSIGFTINGNYYTEEITNEQDIKRLNNKINYSYRGMRLYITNIKFRSENKVVCGTPLCLKLSH